jgi:membrane protein YdbS with pleckstrin-like domain
MPVENIIGAIIIFGLIFLMTIVPLVRENGWREK